MAILTSSDISIYAPSVTLEGDALTGVITQAQALAESSLGANRPLELTEFTEVKRVNRSLQTVYLSYFPVAASPVPLLSVRFGNVRSRFGRPVGISDWHELSADDYELDPTGQLNLSQSSAFWARAVSTGSVSTEIKATYIAGFDFTVDSYEVRQIKSVVGSVIAFQQSEGSGQGLKSFDYDGEYKKSFFGNSDYMYSAPPGLLSQLHKYRPKGVI